MFFSSRSSAVLLAGIVALTAAPSARAQTAPSQTTPQIVTTGVGEAHVTPDRAAIFIGVQSRALTASAAASDNARRQREILNALLALGVANEQISTSNYSVNPEMQYSQSGQTPPKVTGYVVTNTVRVDVRKIEDVGKLIDAALSKGANTMSGLQFYSSKADSARRAALAAAVTSARADAEAMARAAGGSLGGLIELSNTPSQSPRPFEMMARTASAAQAPTPIEPGEQTVSESVVARWSFLPGR